MKHTIYTANGKRLRGRVIMYGGNTWLHSAYSGTWTVDQMEAAAHHSHAQGSMCSLYSAAAGYTFDMWGNHHRIHGARVIKRTRDGKRARRAQTLTATAAAVFVAHAAAKAAYRLQTNGTASAESGLHMVRAATDAAAGVWYRTAGTVDAATRVRLIYDALASDTSGAAVEMFGNAYAAILEKRGHAGAAQFTAAQFKAAISACNAVLYAAKAQRIRTAASVEEWRNGEQIDAVQVPTAWDVYTYEELEYLRTERDAIAAACGSPKAARFIAYRLQGLTLVQIAEKFGVSVRMVDKIAASVRAAYNRVHGTAYGTAAARVKEN